MIKKNDNKKSFINSAYDPFTGEGCYGDRVRLEIPDAPVSVLHLPKEMTTEPVVKLLMKKKSIAGLILSQNEKPTPEIMGEFWIKLCELRFKYDFEFWAIICVTIQDKQTAKDIPFRLNRGQRRLLKSLMDMLLRGRPIRIILLKARQWGGSTLIQIFMSYVQLVHKINWNSVICAHLKDASLNIRAMYEKVINHLPAFNGEAFRIKPFAGTQNIKEVPNRGCRITVGSAEEPESVRSQDVKMAHFSEVGLYPNTEKKKTEDLIASITGSIPREPFTIIAYESTAKGVGDFFHSEWERSFSGESVFEPVFVPWYLLDLNKEEFNGDYYNHSGKKIEGTINDFAATLTDYERNLFLNHEECTLENLNWYRGKLSEMTSHAMMMQEYPSDPIEAFQDAGMPAFRSEDVESMRKDCRPPEAVGVIDADAPASASKMPERRKDILSNIRFIEHEYSASLDPKTRLLKERNKLKIWVFPEEKKYLHRFLVIVDTGGRSEKADYSVITVIDRFWMMYGGKPEIAAQWRGHIDHDILVWIAAQIATYYDNALLVFESNTHESEKNDGVHGEFIFDTISEYYDNLYSRTPADKIREGAPAVWGFHTNKETKTMIVDEFVGVLREKSYKERDEEALNEARWYEQKKTTVWGAKQGKHDDILMTRMIGMHICFEMPIPQEIKESEFRVMQIAGESSF